MAEGMMNIDAGHVAAIVAVVSILFEVTPIKINPIAFLLKWAGQKMFEPFNEKMKELERTIDENKIDTIKWEILEFANSCRNNRRHTKDEFEHIISQNDKYHKLLEKYKMENGVFDAEYAYILRKAYAFSDSFISAGIEKAVADAKIEKQGTVLVSEGVIADEVVESKSAK